MAPVKRLLATGIAKNPEANSTFSSGFLVKTDQLVEFEISPCLNDDMSSSILNLQYFA